MTQSQRESRADGSSKAPEARRALPQRRAELTALTLVSVSRFGFAVAFVATQDLSTRLLLIFAAGLSDVIDGFWARHRQLTTRWGALLDPLADRAFVLTVLVTYLAEGALSGWAFAVLIARDVATTFAYGLTRLLPGFRHVTFQARISGKIVTATQFLVLVVTPLASWLVLPLVLLNAVATAWAIVDYTLAVWRQRTPPPPRPHVGFRRPTTVP